MKYAVAILNIKPAEFWELTLAEFNVIMNSYEWKIRQERIRNAEQAQWYMLPRVKADNIPSIKQMLGESEEEKEKEVTTEDDLEDMKARMGK